MKKTNKLAELLKPAVDKAIIDAFGIATPELYDRKKLKFLPRQAVFYFLKEKYGCSDSSIKGLTGACPPTIDSSCARVKEVIALAGREAEQISRVETALLTETLGNTDLAQAIETASQNGSDAALTPKNSKNDEFLHDKEKVRAPVSSGRFLKKASRAIQEQMLGGILFAHSPELQVLKARKFLLYLLWSDGHLSLAEIKRECVGVEDRDVFEAIGWVLVIDSEDKSVAAELKTIRASL